VEEALEACNKAAEIDPEVHYYLGKVYLQKGMAKEAKKNSRNTNN
jgi:hypothetical protein